MNTLAIWLGRIGYIMGFILVALLFLYAILLLQFSDTSKIDYLLIIIIFSFPFILLLIFLTARKGVNLYSQGDKKGIIFILLCAILLSIPHLISTLLPNNLAGKNYIPIVFAPVPTIFLFLSGIIGIFSQPKH